MAILPWLILTVTGNSSVIIDPILQKRELVDLATVSDQEIKNDDVIYMVFAKEGTGGWEELQVDTLVPFGDEGGGDHGPGNA